jgi:hypothetical protein
MGEGAWRARGCLTQRRCPGTVCVDIGAACGRNRGVPARASEVALAHQ